MIRVPLLFRGLLLLHSYFFESEKFLESPSAVSTLRSGDMLLGLKWASQYCTHYHDKCFGVTQDCAHCEKHYGIGHIPGGGLGSVMELRWNLEGEVPHEIDYFVLGTLRYGGWVSLIFWNFSHNSDNWRVWYRSINNQPIRSKLYSVIHENGTQDHKIVGINASTL